jgi:hypothetical protein
MGNGQQAARERAGVPEPRGRRVAVRVSDDARAAVRPGEVLVIDWLAAGRCAPPLGQVAVHRVDRRALAGTNRFEPLGADGPVAVLAHRRLLGHLAGRTVRIDCRHRRWRRPRFTADLPPAFSLCVGLGEPPPPGA